MVAGVLSAKQRVIGKGIKLTRCFLKKYSIIVLSIFVVVLFAGCAGRFGVSAQPDTSAYDVNLKVSFIHQKSESLCGLASIEMVADYYGRTLNARYHSLLEKEAGETGGIMAASLKACMEASGFDVAVFPGTPDKSLQGIYRHLDLKRPLIILMAEKHNTIGHYIVITGYQSKSHMLSVLNPGHGPVLISENDILPIWENADRLTFLALPAGN
jgi:ABC-type bacteriocin/lantibiotic exporter with double-glycine peptidase domain